MLFAVPDSQSNNRKTRLHICSDYVKYFLVSNLFSLLGLLLIVFVVLIYALWAIPPSPSLTIQNNSYARRFGNHSNGVVLGNSTDNLFWIIHISDTHLSDIVTGIYDRFQQFCSSDVKVINPALVVHTGDITDAKPFRTRSQHQIEEQWQRYKEILQSNGLYNSSFWFDIRGNHDDYGVSDFYAEDDYFSKYSVQAQAVLQRNYSNNYNSSSNSAVINHLNNRVFTKYVNTTFGKYAFVGFDAANVPGLSYPLNYFASSFHTVSKDMPTSLAMDLMEAVTRAGTVANHTVLLGHYPIAAITEHMEKTPAPKFFQALHDKAPFTAYLCGHLHMRDLHSRLAHGSMGHSRPHNGGFLELEVADFKYKSAYRIAAFDGDIFSFVDVSLGDWPVLLPTNPKDARMLSDDEPYDRIANSTHIRVLVFSPTPVSRVSFTIDGERITEDAHGAALSSTAWLYTYPWDPTRYANTGVHHLTVSAVDSNGKVKAIEAMPFSVTGQTVKLSWLASFIQNLPARSFLVSLMVILYLFSFLVLLIQPVITLAVLRRYDQYDWFEKAVGDHFAQLDQWSTNYQCCSKGSQRQTKIPHPYRISSHDGGGDDISYNNNNNNNNNGDIDGEIWGSSSSAPSQPTSTATATATATARRRNLYRLLTIVRNKLLADTWSYGMIPWPHRTILIVYAVLMAVGPWFIGPTILGRHWGALFMWGVLVDSRFVPFNAEFLIFYCCFHIAFVYLPLVIYCSLPYNSSAVFALYHHRHHHPSRPWIGGATSDSQATQASRLEAAEEESDPSSPGSASASASASASVSVSGYYPYPSPSSYAPTSPNQRRARAHDLLRSLRSVLIHGVFAFGFKGAVLAPLIIAAGAWELISRVSDPYGGITLLLSPCILWAFIVTMLLMQSTHVMHFRNHRRINNL